VPDDAASRAAIMTSGLSDEQIAALAALAQCAEAVGESQPCVAVVGVDDDREVTKWTAWSDRSTRQLILLSGARTPIVPRVCRLHPAVDADTLAQVATLAIDRVVAADEHERTLEAERQGSADVRHQAWIFDCYMNSVPDVVFIKDRQSRFLRCSEVWKRAFAPNRAYEGLTDFDIFPGQADPWFAVEQRIVETGVPEWELESDQLRHNPYLATRVPLRDREGNIVGTTGTHTNLSRLGQIEYELVHSNALLNALLEKLPDRIYFKDPQCRYIRCSRSLAAQFGLENPEQIHDRTDADFFTDEHAAAIHEEELRIMRRQEVIQDKLGQERHRDGRVTWSLTSKIPLVNRQGNVIGLMGIAKDVTQLKHAEQELERLNEQLMKTSRQAGMAEVATGVLHNVGNVLNSVNVAASMATRRVRDYQVHNLRRLASLVQAHEEDLSEFITADERGRNLPGFIGHLADHMSRSEEQLLEEMHALARNIDHIKEIVSTQQSYARTAGLIEVVNVVDVIEDALRINTAALEREGIAVSRSFEPVDSVEIDRPKVLQILVNLISNARHALRSMPDGQRRLSLSLREVGDTAGPFVEIRVTDNGVGIKAENLRRIFAHGFTTRHDGHGFGLHSGAIAARSLGGRLVAESDGDGCGASFTLVLPKAPAGVRS
jgi:PAS domain S-box-containing protein